jgi:hypothetical protein
MFKNSVRTAKEAQHFTITKTNWLTLFKKTIILCTENHKKKIQNEEFPIVKSGGMYTYH